MNERTNDAFGVMARVVTRARRPEAIDRASNARSGKHADANLIANRIDIDRRSLDVVRRTDDRSIDRSIDRSHSR